MGDCLLYFFRDSRLGDNFWDRLRVNIIGHEFYLKKGHAVKIDNKSIIIFLIAVFLHSTAVASQPKDTARLEEKIVTHRDALSAVRKIMDDFPFNDVVAAQQYEKSQSSLLVKCAYILYNSARMQLLEALREIDMRKAYWQYQKDHQWQYFLTKNPIKWVTGPSQDQEIKNNLELLDSCQGELYVLLGQLLEQSGVFAQEYKTSFWQDTTKAYAWVDGLIALLARVRVPDYNRYDDGSFMARAMALKLKLEGVRYFKEDVLSDIKETQVPSQFAQNWLKYGTLGLALGYGYNAGGVEKLKNSFNYVTQEVSEFVISPVQKLMTEVFGGENIDDEILRSEFGKKKIITSLPTTQHDTLALAKEFVIAESEKYDIKPEEVKQDATSIQDITNDMDNGDYGSFQKFLEVMKDKGKLELTLLHPFKSVETASEFANNRDDYVSGTKFLYELQTLSATAQMEKALVGFIEKQQKQFAGVSKLVLLTPAALTGALAYAGYQKLSTKNYSQIRRALLDVNSLFVDQSKPLSDESYGKMVYLLYNLKKLAEKDLPQKKNVRAEFLQDLEKIESKEFDVAAKRRIIDDMFKKYSFLAKLRKK